MTMRDMVPFGRNRTRQTPARRRSEVTPFDRFHDEVDRLFEDFFGNYPLARQGEEENWPIVPEVDVQETDNEIIVNAELPGVEEKDLDLRIDNGNLTLKGEKEEKDENKEGDMYHTERRYGSFMRTIPLNAEVDAENAEANFKNGVLNVKLPKIGEKEEEGKKIEVKTGK